MGHYGTFQRNEVNHYFEVETNRKLSIQDTGVVLRPKLQRVDGCLLS